MMLIPPARRLSSWRGSVVAVCRDTRSGAASCVRAWLLNWVQMVHYGRDNRFAAQCHLPTSTVKTAVQRFGDIVRSFGGTIPYVYRPGRVREMVLWMICAA